MTLIYLAACFLTGVYADSILQWPVTLPLVLGMAPLGAAIVWRQPGRRFLAVCLLAFLLGIARWSGGQVEVGPDHVAAYLGRPGIKLTGTVAAAPDVRDTSTRLLVEIDGVTSGGAAASAHGLVQVTVGRYPIYHYGDRLEMLGKLEQAPVFEDFSYRDYLARQGILAVAYHPRIVTLEEGRGNPLLAALYRLRDGAQAAIVSALPEPQAGLTGGVLLGARSALPPDLTRALQIAGLTHIVVVSGFNLTIVAAVLQRLASRRWGPYGSFVVSVAGVLAFTLLVGAGAAVVRSAIMVIVAMFGLLLGRQNAALNALALAAGLMVAWQPMLLWDVGFQLSAAATLGLVWLSPVIEGWLGRVPSWMRGGLATALAAQALTAPILADNFHLLSIVSPVANLAVLWAVPWLMLAGLAPIVAGLLPWPAAAVAGGPAWLIATYIASAARWAAALPWAAVTIPSLPTPVWVAYYLVVALLASRARPGSLTSEAEERRPRANWHQRLALGGLAVTALLAWAVALSLPDGRVHVAFLDVGEGSATLIRTARGQTVLVDGGPSPVALAEGLGRQLPFWQRTLDMVVLSHADEDHLLGLVDLGARYRIGQVLESGRPGDSPGYARWSAQLAAAGVTRTVAAAGQRVPLGEGAWLEVVTSGSEVGGLAASNSSSLVLRLAVGNASVLLPGDAEADTLRWLAATGRPVSATVLALPHHGARAGLDAEALRRVAPTAAVISVGAGNRFGHPAPETLELLRDLPVYRTDVHGTIELIMDGAVLTVLTGG